MACSAAQVEVVSVDIVGGPLGSPRHFVVGRFDLKGGHELGRNLIFKRENVFRYAGKLLSLEFFAVGDIVQGHDDRHFVRVALNQAIHDQVHPRLWAIFSSGSLSERLERLVSEAMRRSLS